MSASARRAHIVKLVDALERDARTRANAGTGGASYDYMGHKIKVRWQQEQQHFRYAIDNALYLRFRFIDALENLMQQPRALAPAPPSD